MLAKGITEIIKVPDLGTTPAVVNRKTGVMYISEKHMKAMPKEHILFVLLHEKAHVELQTTNEDLADAQAFKEYAALGYPLTEAIKALTRVLNDKNPAHFARMYNQLKRAKEYDYRVNGNLNVLKR